MFDRDQTLWCGFMLGWQEKHFYFAGDSGYGSFFQEIGQRFRPVTGAIIPIGAFQPRWFMSPIHIGPDEALRVHREVGAACSLAAHFGTFPLADDEQTEAPDLFDRLIREDPTENPFIRLEEGSWIELDW